MPSRRKRKKGECSHLQDGPRFLVTDDPYPIYNSELYCKCGYFDWTWGNHSSEEFPCDKCKRFTISRKKIRETNREAKERKRNSVRYELDIYWNRITIKTLKSELRWLQRKKLKIRYSSGTANIVTQLWGTKDQHSCGSQTVIKICMTIWNQIT